MKKLILLMLVFSFVKFNGYRKSGKQVVSLIDNPLSKEAPGDGDDPEAAMEFRYNMLKGKKPYLDPLARRRAINYTKKMLLMHKSKSVNTISTWNQVGPGNIGGRIRSIIVKPTDHNTMLIGAVAGGVWKTTNGGASWSPKTDDGNPIAIGCMVNEGDTVYAGTGEAWGNQDAVYGGGIYKSTDFGDTWTLLPSTTGDSVWDFKNVLQLAFDPSGNIYAVTKAYDIKDNIGNYYSNGGLYKSTDGGVHWKNISSSTFTNYCDGCDVVPISSSVILFATNYDDYTNISGGIYKTTNGGSSWEPITNGLPSSTSRTAFAQDPNNPNTIYASLENYGIYKSIDAGNSWVQKLQIDSLDYLETQGWYDNVIAVDPHNSNNIYAGGVNLIKSTDGGSHFSFLTDVYNEFGGGLPYVHPDHHAFAFDPSTADIVYDGDDGGIYKTTDGGASWKSLNNNLAITQFYGGAVYPTGNIFVGGTQDNGQLKYNGSGTNWTNVAVGVIGDGGYTAIDQSNPAVIYAEAPHLYIFKSVDGGGTWYPAYYGISELGGGLFITPLSMDPENPFVLIAGGFDVWVTTDSASQFSWNYIVNSIYPISAATIVDSSSPYLGFVGLTDGEIYKCPDVMDSTWHDITPPSNNGAYVRRIVVDLKNKQHIYACYSGYNDDGVFPTKHVWYSPDQGSDWADISGDLPDVPVHSLVIDPNDSQTLYIGTETGVYQTTNGGTNWVNNTTGMPKYAPVDELVRQTGTNNLFAFTHGRSTFKTSFPLPVELTNFASIVEDGKIALKWETATEVNNYGFEIERQMTNNLMTNDHGSHALLVKGHWASIGFVKGSGNSNSPKNYSFVDSNPGNGKFEYRLKQINNDGSYNYSKTIDVYLSSPTKFVLEQNYPNPFNPTTTILYEIPKAAHVTLKVYDILGNVVETLVDKEQQAGKYSIQFAAGSRKSAYRAGRLASGVYLYRLQAGNFIQTKKMLLLK